MSGPRSILHVDMDAFFVAVELLDDPSLVGRPVVVGGAGARGVVAAASYEARAFGVHSAMSSARARQLCPSATFLPGRYWRYQEISEAVFGVFRAVTPLVEGISLDEAFLDVSGARRRLGDAEAIAAGIRARVRDELGLSCSVGVAPRKLTAKLASEAAKPVASLAGPVPGPGVVVVAPDHELAFLHAHPIRALWGVGPATGRRLDQLGIRTVGDLAATGVASLVAALGSHHGRRLHALAWARDDRPVVPSTRAKSVGHEETFAHDHHDLSTLGPELVRLADAVATRLRRAGLAGRTVTVKVRHPDFRTITRSTTLAEPVSGGRALALAARELLGGVDLDAGVRLLGVSVSGMVDEEAHQLTLDDLLATRPDPSRSVASAAAWSDATRAVDEIRDRFGDAVIGPASTSRRGPKRRGDTQWGPT
ncbi:MAG: DNA polymerase IV [Acidimicrobiia bacterium]